MPAALEALPFEKPQPPEEADSAPIVASAEGNGDARRSGGHQASTPRREAAVEAKPSEAS